MSEILSKDDVSLLKSYFTAILFLKSFIYNMNPLSKLLIFMSNYHSTIF